MSEQTRDRPRGCGHNGRPIRAESCEEESVLSNNSSSDNESGSKVPVKYRGRGAFRVPFFTIPSNVSNTVGEGGSPVALLSNYFRLNVPDDEIPVFQYHVTFDPPVGLMQRRPVLMKHKEMFDNAFMFDGRCDLKMLKKFDEAITVTSISKTEKREIQITITPVGVLGWNCTEMLEVFNVQMRRNFRHLSYAPFFKFFFDPSTRNEIPEHRIQLWQGIVSQINAYDAGILMMCKTALQEIRTVYEVLKKILETDRDNFRQQACRELCGKIVITPYNNRTYRVEDIWFDKNPTYVFQRRQGSISIQDYYKERYGITIRDLRQPLIICSRRKTERLRMLPNQIEQIFLVPELCMITGLTNSLRNNFELQQKMDEITNLDPTSLVQKLETYIHSVNNNSKVKTEMGSWGISFDDKLMEICGRQLDEEQIFMQTPQKYCQKTGDFQEQIVGKKMKEPKDFLNWALIATEADREVINEFVDVLHRACTPMGITMTSPKIQILSNDSTFTFVEACRSVPQELEIVVVVVPNDNKDRYDAIKQVFCVEKGIASQVIISRTISNKQTLMSVCTKIGIQMSVKLGAEVWYLAIPQKDLMVVGYYTYNERINRIQGSFRSVGGFVCSLNSTMTRWYSRADFHLSYDQMWLNFATHLVNGLKRYNEVNGKMPARIVVYREYVSKFEIRHLFESELKKIKNEIRKISANLCLTFVIVKKRVNTQFFLKQDEGYTNPIPGTVVDTVVIRKERFDFYLISQSVRHGTVAPTMYNIIEDESNWTPLHHQQLAYKLCHLYYNWPGTISVPAPCRYARKLAFLTGNSLHCKPNLALSNTLFYL